MYPEALWGLQHHPWGTHLPGSTRAQALPSSILGPARQDSFSPLTLLVAPLSFPVPPPPGPQSYWVGTNGFNLGGPWVQCLPPLM